MTDIRPCHLKHDCDRTFDMASVAGLREWQIHYFEVMGRMP